MHATENRVGVVGACKRADREVGRRFEQAGGHVAARRAARIQGIALEKLNLQEASYFVAEEEAPADFDVAEMREDAQEALARSHLARARVDPAALGI